MKYLIVLLMTLASPLALSLQIQDFKFGPMCGINAEEMGWVCFEQNDIYITGQSSCNIRNNLNKCTWYGFQFDYTGYERGAKIMCSFEQGTKTEIVNLKGKDYKAMSTGTFELELKSDSGSFINPQYSLLRIALPKNQINETKVNCNYKGKHAFGYKYKTIFPLIH